MICNKMVPAGEFCPHCVTQVDLNEAEKQSSVKREIIGSLNRKRRPIWSEPKEWVGLNWGDMPIGQVNNLDFMEGARWAEKWLKEKNA
jgi:hypothetical protein